MNNNAEQPTDADIVRVIESTIAAKNQEVMGTIEDIKDTITHSTWLSVVAVGVLAAVATIVSPSQCIWVQITGACSITAACISIVNSMQQSTLSNTMLYLNRQLLLGNSAIQTELLARRPKPDNLEVFSQQIINESVVSGEYRIKIFDIKSAIKAEGNTERYANLQAKLLLASVVLFGVAAVLPSVTPYLSPCKSVTQPRPEAPANKGIPISTKP